MPTDLDQPKQIDRYSDTWRVVSKWAEAELMDARERIEMPKTDHETTLLKRGRIQVLKELVGLVSQPERTQ